MDTARLPCLVLVVLALRMTRVSAEGEIIKVGGELVLELDPKPATVTRVVWKHGANLLAEFTANVFTYYGSFKGHTALEASGRLTVSKIQRSEGGEYSVEVNNVIQAKRYNVQVFEELGRPTILVTPLACGPGAESCTLVCDLNTTQPEAVTYEWLLAGEETKIGGKELIINQATRAANFTCWAKNPVSQQASASQKNPLISPPKPNIIPAIVGGVMGSLAVVVIVAAGIWRWGKRTASSNAGRSAGSTEPSPTAPLNPAQPNGTDGTGGGDKTEEENNSRV